MRVVSHLMCLCYLSELYFQINRLRRSHIFFQISKIASSIPNLEFLNLSSNPLAGTTLEPECAEAFLRVRRLVLNNTHISWDTVMLLTQKIPE